MKTNLLFQKKIKTFFAHALIVLSFVSCVSYQSTTQDEDGIYGATRTKRVYVDNSAQEYKNYFKDLKEENAQVFTDVEKYSSLLDTTKPKTNTVVEYQTQAHPAWGSNPATVNVTIVDNSWGWNNWGWGMGWNGGWGMGWNNWGWGNPWGWNNWGWNYGWGWNSCWNCGWNNWGWGGNPYWGNGWNNWGYGNNFYYANSRRGGTIRDGYYGNNYSGRYAQSQQGRRSSYDYNNSTRSSGRATLPNSRSSSGTRSYDNNTRTYDNGTRGSGTRSTSQPTRSYENNGTRSNSGSSTPTRTYTPAPSRSSSSGGSYGGSRSSGGSSGGGGRSSGGGGGRRG